ncbi:unnamed protein product [Xylocopa violacea]|uniref:Uncharacterized protein n=1 Tax=Xylocopa violacea TaxID=135666 RepID=A0ABP1PA53_XYLVO
MYKKWLDGTYLDILGVDESLIRRYYALLIALSFGHEINVEKFKDFAKRAAALYVNLYPWYYMSVTEYKILGHEPTIKWIGQIENRTSKRQKTIHLDTLHKEWKKAAEWRGKLHIMKEQPIQQEEQEVDMQKEQGTSEPAS